MSDRSKKEKALKFALILGIKLWKMRDARFYNSSCPLTRTVGQIGNKWKPIIINVLQLRTMRFGQLSAVIPIITRKVLTEQLRELEADGIVSRKYFKEALPRTEYSLTDKGLAILPILKGMIEWNLTFDPGTEGDDGSWN